jgi:hypothetical protein
MKKINKKHAEFLKNPETLKASGLTEETQEKIRNYKPRYSWEPHPYPPYELTNLNGNMRRVKERIAELEAKEAMPDVDKVINGVRIVTDKAYNRVRVFFPSIPSEETRGRLKQNGFRWCPTESAWQRQISEYAISQAEEIVKETTTATEASK